MKLLTSNDRTQWLAARRRLGIFLSPAQQLYREARGRGIDKATARRFAMYEAQNRAQSQTQAVLNFIRDHAVWTIPEEGDSGKMMADHHVCADGWICEAHPDTPWPHGDCAGPGMLCRTAGCPALKKFLAVFSPHDLHDLLIPAVHELWVASQAYQKIWTRHCMSGTGEGIVETAVARGRLFGAIEAATEKFKELKLWT